MITEDLSEYFSRIDRFVDQNIHYCVSQLIDHLAKDDGGECWDEVLSVCICHGDDGDDGDECFREVLEHWLVSDRLAVALESRGETVSRDIYGLVVWGRCTTGQSISMDCVIQDIYREGRKTSDRIYPTALPHPHAHPRIRNRY
jgi:hypothetical protein